jgi:hypothetical protein
MLRRAWKDAAEMAYEVMARLAKFGLLNDGISRESAQVGCGVSVNTVVRAGIGCGVLSDRRVTIE